MILVIFPDFHIPLEDSPEDWHLAPIRGYTRIHKLFPFYPTDLATLDTHGITTISQLFEIHLSGRIDTSISPELLTLLTLYLSLQHKHRIFTRAFSQKPFHNKYANPRNKSHQSQRWHSYSTKSTCA